MKKLSDAEIAEVAPACGTDVETVRQIEDRVDAIPEGEEQADLVATEAAFRGQQARKRLGG
ncbi:hypothetical protein [Leisingera sp. ANG-M1]|uniref:hypothetical protein n=1 Tax=Leisingera sp. ANG-M1 TaxID=1577895 RepID=UPI001269CA84|nr:hypothetical protein [Leisingera sp. ANG-M1]